MTPLSATDPAATSVVLMAASQLLDSPEPASGEALELVAAAVAELPSISARGHLEQFTVWWGRGARGGARGAAAGPA